MIFNELRLPLSPSVDFWLCCFQVQGEQLEKVEELAVPVTPVPEAPPVSADSEEQTASPVPPD